MSEEQENKAGIRTPDRRLRVFVSSTLGELADERRAVSRAISALRLTPVMFGQGARPHPPRDVYRGSRSLASWIRMPASSAGLSNPQGKESR